MKPRWRLAYSSADNIGQGPNQAHRAAVLPGQQLAFAAAGQRETIGLGYAHEGEAYQIFVSAEDRAGWARLHQLGQLLGNVDALASSILAGWYFAGAVARISRQAGRIAATNLGRRLAEGNGRDEPAQLARAFNGMLYSSRIGLRKKSAKSTKLVR